MNKLQNNIRTKIEEKFVSLINDQLKAEPHFGSNIKKLQNYTPETWRYRIGRFRIFYIIDEEEKIVVLISVDDRRDAY